MDFGEHLRLIALDTEWWLDDPDVRKHVENRCPSGSEKEIISALRNSLSSAGKRYSIVVGHHPLQTNGRHGGFFDWTTHIFPLREWHRSLWIPLPVLGSFYVYARKWDSKNQDLSSTRYQHMIEQLESVFSKNSPLLYAAGHEHNLQLLRGKRNVPYVLISGVGSIQRFNKFHRASDTLFASPHAGFMRLDFLHNGAVNLQAIEIHKDGGMERTFSTELAHVP